MTSSTSSSKQDPYFNGNEDVLKSYEFDRERMAEFWYKTEKQGEILQLIFTAGLCLPCCLATVCGQGEANAKDLADAQHLALTKDGVKYVVEEHLTDCRREAEKEGRVSQTAAYDKITDCDIEAPAGAEGCDPCCLIPRVMYKVNIQSAGSGFVIEGLKDPEQFKKDVWNVKRGAQVDGVEGVIAPSGMAMARAEAVGPQVGLTTGSLAAESTTTNRLLTDILAAIREQTDALKLLGPK